MKLPDGTILMHVQAPYDPVKAHEYYLRTRKLKGRKKGTTFTVKSASGKTVILSAKELAEQKAYAAKRVIKIKQKLAELNSKLKEAIRDAKAKQSKSKREAAKPASAAEKSKAARESEKYRDKHKQELATKSKKASAAKKQSADSDPVAMLEQIVNKVSDNLKAAVARQRALARATKNK